MTAKLQWKREPGGTYAWPLGMHYYAEEHSRGEWTPCMMINETDVWTGPSCKTRKEAETVMQEHFEAELAEYVR